MGTYAKILVAVDLSPESEQVLQIATDMAEMNNAQIALMHVTEHPQAIFTHWSDYVVPYSEEHIRSQLFKNLVELAQNSGISSDLVSVEFGRTVDAIVSRADAENFDLIVLGSHGRHGVQLLLGSTANGVLHHAKCDVLAVRVGVVIEQV
jgi:universal stress protein A